MQILIAEHMRESNTEYDLVWATIEFVESALAMLYAADELPQTALDVYYVDFYLQQVNNGGFSQFVFGCQWDAEVVLRVQSGLDAVGAVAHRMLFGELCERVEGLRDSLEELLDPEAGDEPLRAALDGLDSAYDALEGEESLIGLMHAYLLQSDAVEALPPGPLEAALAELAEEVPDLEARMEAAQSQLTENEPPELRITRALCEQAGQTIESINATDSDSWQGEPAMRVHVSTDQGYHIVLLMPGKALLVVGDTDEVIAEADLDQPA